MKKLLPAVFLLMGLAALVLVDRIQVRHADAKNKLELESASSLVQVRLEDSIAVRFGAIEALGALFAIHPATTGPEFGRFADILLASNPPIRALQFADRQTRVIYSYPPKGNEITIEKPMLLLADPKRGPFTAKAIRERREVLQGPFPLRQGGVGAVVRLPVFRGGEFLGLAIGVFDVPVLIKEALAGMDPHQFLIHLADADGKVFWGAERLPGQSVSRAVAVADTGWTVSVAWNPERPMPSIMPRLLVWLFGVGFLLSLALFAWKSLCRAETLGRAVKARTAELEKSEERYRALFEKSPLGMVYLDAEGVAVDVNDNTLCLLGLRRDEVVGFRPPDFMAAPCLGKYLVRALAGEYCEHEVEYDQKGKDILVRVLCNPVSPGRGETPLILTLEDVTERRRMEEVQNKARKAAEEANKAKSEFLANMSHEIRTPLSGISGMLQLLGATRLNGEEADLVDKALYSTRRLTRLLSDLLDLSRIEVGKLELRPEPFDFADHLEALGELLRPSAQQKGLDLVLQMDPGVPRRLVGDSARLQQVLLNVAGNAVKFTEKGRVAVSATHFQGPGSGRQRLLVSISDTGPGMDDESLSRLFKPFVQGVEGYTRGFQGAGLGLSITKRLVALMGGSMAVDNSPGEGTTFHILLPMESAGTASSSVSDRVERGGHGGLRILLAEDDAITRLAIARMLELGGYAVKAVGDGKEALDSLKQEPYDLLLLDVQMPFLDGVQATMAIRRGEAGESKAAVPIVAITAYAMVGDREKFLDAGMDAYLSKPLELRDLHKALDNLLKKTRGGPAETASA